MRSRKSVLLGEACRLALWRFFSVSFGGRFSAVQYIRLARGRKARPKVAYPTKENEKIARMA
jgi:hypothetical protein